MHALVLMIALSTIPAAHAKAPEQKEIQTAQAKNWLRNFQQMLADYKRYCHQFPITEQGLDALVKNPSTAPLCPNYPESGFVVGNKIPADPWGHPYLYESDGKSFVVTTLGKDGKPGGEGENRDLEIKNPL